MIIKNLILGAVALCSLSMIMTACNGSRRRGEKGRTVVAVSIPPQQFFVDNIAGDRVETVCLLGGLADPESFEPSMKQFMDLENAQVYMPVGVFAFEKAITDRLKSNHKDLKVIKVTDGVEALYDTHGHDHGHEGDKHDEGGEADPHMWSSAVNAKIIALNTLNALVEADPANEDVYRANYARLDARLDSVDMCFNKLFEGEDVARSFAVWHPSLSYFARDYGLKQVSLVDAGKESSVKSLAASLKNTGGEDCRIYFFQQEFDSGKAAELVKESGVKVVNINPMNREWEDEMQKLYDAFTNN